MNKHANYEILNLIGYYEILNLIGYGLAKFDMDFIQKFGFKTKSEFYEYFVNKKIADTKGTIKNRMDLFDPFFPNNNRKGWWQKGNTYIHRKIVIDSLFGECNAYEYANIVKIYLKEYFTILQDNTIQNVKPIEKSKFKQLQRTGFEAEIYFMNNFTSIILFNNSSIEDARLFGDGYDFQLKNTYLAEIKGIRNKKGKFRLTENEYNKATEYKEDYIIVLIMNLNENPSFKIIQNPVKNIEFIPKIIMTKQIKEFHVAENITL